MKEGLTSMTRIQKTNNSWLSPFKSLEEWIKTIAELENPNQTHEFAGGITCLIIKWADAGAKGGVWIIRSGERWSSEFYATVTYYRMPTLGLVASLRVTFSLPPLKYYSNNSGLLFTRDE